MRGWRDFLIVRILPPSSSGHHPIHKDIDFDEGVVERSSATMHSVFDMDEQHYEYKQLSLDAASSTTDTLGRSYLIFDLQRAWDSGLVAREDYPLSHNSRSQLLRIVSMLSCGQCCLQGVSQKQQIMVYDDDYIESIRTSTKWWDGHFMGSFGQMASHYAHTTIDER
jgi:hypothetical protein